MTSANTSAAAPTPVTPLTPIPGLHHVTAITGDVQRNADFYTRALGLRMVKVTINYDDPSSFHLYYGDALGRPGTAITFFGWPGGRRAAPGSGQVSETAFNIPPDAAPFWHRRLTQQNVAAVASITRFGAAGLTFRDPDGLPIALLESPAADDLHLWPEGGISNDVALRGFHSVTLAEQFETAPASILVNRFGYRETARDANRIRYEAHTDSATAPSVGRIVDVLTDPSATRPRMGTGEVHHVAFRTPTDAAQLAWLETLGRDGHNVSPVMDRNYFHSIYFREPGGTLFEIATDTPGFTLNEPADALATKIMLPPWLESQRPAVEAALPPLRLNPILRGASTHQNA